MARARALLLTERASVAGWDGACQCIQKKFNFARAWDLFKVESGECRNALTERALGRAVYWNVNLH